MDQVKCTILEGFRDIVQPGLMILDVWRVVLDVNLERSSGHVMEKMSKMMAKWSPGVLLAPPWSSERHVLHHLGHVLGVPF